MLNNIANIIVLVTSSLMAILSVIEKSQSIKSKPLSKLFGIDDIKNDLKCVKENTKALQDKIIGIDRKVDLNDAKTIRNRVLNMEYLLRSNAPISEPQLRSTKKDIYDYYEYKKIYPELDGELEIAKVYIEQKYNELFNK